VDIAGVPTIIAAQSREDLGNSEIVVWQKGKSLQAACWKSSLHRTKQIIQYGIFFFMFFASVAFIFQNFTVSDCFAKGSVEKLSFDRSFQGQ
jgi:hypothetical protein